MSDADLRTLKEAERVCRNYRKGLYKTWSTIAHANLITFLETALKVIKEKETNI